METDCITTMKSQFISKDEAINALSAAWPLSNSDYVLIKKAIETTPPADVVPVPRWIPVTERFPPLDKEVLVFAIGLPEWGFEGKTTTAIAYRFIYRFWSGGKEYEVWSTPWEYFHKDYKITHWMPLPEPPKEGGGEDG